MRYYPCDKVSFSTVSDIVDSLGGKVREITVGLSGCHRSTMVFAPLSARSKWILRTFHGGTCDGKSRYQNHSDIEINNSDDDAKERVINALLQEVLVQARLARCAHCGKATKPFLREV